MAIWWITEAIPLFLTGFVPIAVFPLMHIKEGSIWENFFTIALPYLDYNIFLFLGGMFIAAAMQTHGLEKRIALTIIKIIGHSQDGLLLAFMVATAFISLWISNSATAVMMVPIGLAVINQIR